MSSQFRKVSPQVPSNDPRWVFSRKAQSSAQAGEAILLTRPDEKTPFKKVVTTNFRESVNPQFFTFDNKNLYATSNIGRDKSAVVTIDPGNGKELEKIYENPEVDVDALAAMNTRFNEVYANTGRDSIAPEKLIRALLLQVFYSIRERAATV